MAELRITTLFHDANLLDYYRLEGNSNDEIGSQTGSDTAITYNSGNGKYGQGAGLNGTTSNIALPNSNNFKQTGNFTVVAWFKTSTTGVDQEFFTNFSSASSVYAGWLIEVGPSNKLQFSTFRNTGSVLGTDYQTITGNTTVTDGVYHAAAATWDGSNLRIYLDGASDATAVSWANAPGYKATMHPRIGAYDDTAALFFTGAVDEVAIFSRALSASEILNLASDPGTTTSTSTSSSTTTTSTSTTTTTSTSTSSSTSTTTTSTSTSTSTTTTSTSTSSSTSSSTTTSTSTTTTSTSTTTTSTSTTTTSTSTTITTTTSTSTTTTYPYPFIVDDEENLDSPITFSVNEERRQEN